MKWNDLRVFSVVASAGSLSAAARELGISQPTVGRHIDSLEATLNKRLFDRQSRGYVLSDQGLELLPKVEAMERAAFAIEESSQSDLSGVIKLAIPEITSRFLGKRLLPLQKLYPGLTIEIATSNQFVNLSRREADIALRTELPSQGDLRTKRVMSTQAAVYASHQYLADNPQALSDARYNDCDWILPLKEVTSKQASSWYAQHIREKNIRYRCGSLHVMMDLALSGAGLILWTTGYAKDVPGLKKVSPAIPSQNRDYWLVAHSEALNQPRIRAVWDWLVELLDKEQHRFNS
ncbi:LysR family transcriptional regulator [Kiloniella antarctica]|uniref:LysR family transcriptional regulator n=1 Tax=Kiloniella antarctica TaxID=1550907 RepID=A0ABW5BPL6_9PROT